MIKGLLTRLVRWTDEDESNLGEWIRYVIWLMERRDYIATAKDGLSEFRKNPYTGSPKEYTKEHRRLAKRITTFELKELKEFPHCHGDIAEAQKKIQRLQAKRARSMAAIAVR